MLRVNAPGGAIPYQRETGAPWAFVYSDTGRFLGKELGASARPPPPIDAIITKYNKMSLSPRGGTSYLLLTA